MTPSPDFELTDHEETWLLTPLSEAAREWIKDELCTEYYAVRYGSSYVILPCYVVDIFECIRANDLTVARPPANIVYARATIDFLREVREVDLADMEPELVADAMLSYAIALDHECLQRWAHAPARDRERVWRYGYRAACRLLGHPSAL